MIDVGSGPEKAVCAQKRKHDLLFHGRRTGYSKVCMVFQKSLDYPFIFFRFHAADGKNQDPVLFDQRGQAVEKARLLFGQSGDIKRLGRPFGVGIAPQHPQARAGRIQKNTMHQISFRQNGINSDCGHWS